MKILILIISICALFPTYATEGEGEQLLDAAKSSLTIANDIKDVGIIKPDCQACTPTSKFSVFNLDKKEIDIGHPYYIKDKGPYIVHLKRNKNSPTKAYLKLKNGHAECGRTYIGPVSTMPGANWTVECFFEITVYEDEEIVLDLKNFPITTDDEQVIAVKFHKKDPRRSKYTVDLEVIQGPPAKTDISSNFWVSGYTIEVKN